MADTKMNQTPDSTKQDERNQKLRSEANQADNQTMRHEQAKSAVSGEQGKPGEKSAIGGGSSGSSQQFSGQTGNQAGNQPGGSQTGEPGRARNELGQGQERKDEERKGEFDKNKNESTGQQR